MEAVFITGTDTGVGKTSICAGLLKLLVGTRKVCYWKPIQTGTVVGDDTFQVQELTNLGPEYFMDPLYRFTDPISPHIASRDWKVSIDIEKVASHFEQKLKEGYFMIVEGVGGLLAPLNENTLQVHLIARLRVPVLIVGQNRLGTINQNLLTIGACRRENISVLGVILTMTRSSTQRGNAESIAQFGGVEVLAEIDDSEDSHKRVTDVSCHPRLRELLRVPPLPT